MKGPDDWVCVYDFCGSNRLLGRSVDCSADWSPSRKTTVFSGNWFDVPDMPSEGEPCEADIHAWVAANPGFLQRRENAALARKKESEDRTARTMAFYAKHGAGTVRAEFRAPDGKERVIEHGCGIHGPLYMLPLAVTWMRQEMPPGTVLRKLTVSRKKPARRGELKEP